MPNYPTGPFTEDWQHEEAYRMVVVSISHPELQPERTTISADISLQKILNTMRTGQRIHCSLCNVSFYEPDKLRDAKPIEHGSERKTALPGELYQWMTELRFIAKNTTTGYPPVLRLKTQSLKSLLEYTHQNGDTFLVYRLPDLESEVIVGAQEGSYSIRSEKGEEQLALALFPIHYECIELLRVLKSAYNLTQDDIWRVLAEGFPEHAQDVDEAQYKYPLSNPTTIRTLTQYVLSLLHPISPNHHHPHHKYNQRSPSPEFSSSVCYANYDGHHIPTDAEADAHLQQAQREYRDKLLSGVAIPYIWDLNAGKCLEKDGGDQVWDWKGLIEDLSRLLDVRDDTTLWEGAPMGLRNRCRIWYAFRQRLERLGLGVGANSS
ncbi:hypothetical protein FQN54_005489 [Arachnomyces sp. PD_36]|nr:hypothetical protein FQN54_005489 [Arachnomyces sp. PD_36]